MTPDDLNLTAVWEYARKLMFDWSDRVTPTLQAMNVAVPITLDDSTLILGMDARIHNLSSHLQVPAQRADIKRALKVASGQDLDFRVIEGTSIEDWNRLKSGPGAVPAVTVAATDRTSGVWEELSFKMHNAYKDLKQKQNPLVRVRFFDRMLDEVMTSADRAKSEEHTDEGFQRHLAQALERLAAMADLAPTVVALEYLRRRGDLR